MMRAARGLALLCAIAALGACGSRKALVAKPGMEPVPVARGADKPETPDQLVTPSTQARPDRSAEQLRRSQEREPDPFDLPPS